MRLDQLLVARGLVPTRARARDAVKRGAVRVAGRPVAKPGEEVAADADLVLDDPAAAWVSRAALKLVAGLDAFGLAVAGLNALDLGASTGGFTQVLLTRGAARVVAVDVGHGQLHPSLAADPRVLSLEGLNARELTAADLPFAPEVVVADVSFISLTLALPPALGLAAPGAVGVFLVKPQFEVGRAGIGKGGLVRPDADVAGALARVRATLATAGWQGLGEIVSPIAGGDGNTEYVLGARKTSAGASPA
jgi:23S rRNA (cytidine1920-2'-O)/16S rRNA (cytidine1409-2'-O)-methyltransferase